MHEAIRRNIAGMKGITLKDLKGFKRISSEVILEGNALYRSIKVNGYFINPQVAIRLVPELQSSNFQWGCVGHFVPQLLSAYTILLYLNTKKEEAAKYTNLLSELLSHFPDNFKVTFDMKKLIIAVANVQDVTPDSLRKALEENSTIEAVEDPNAPVMEYEPKVAVLGAVLDRK